MDWKRTAVLGATVALAAGGCGSAKPLTKAQFDARAEAVCVQARTDAVALLKEAVAQQKAGGKSTAQLRAEFAPKVPALKQREFKQLEALKLPDELKDTFAQWRAEVGREAGLTNAPHATLVAFAKHRDQLKTTLGIRQDCI